MNSAGGIWTSRPSGDGVHGAPLTGRSPQTASGGERGVRLFGVKGGVDGFGFGMAYALDRFEFLDAGVTHRTH